MPHQEPTVVFDQERAATYDQKFARLSAMREALQLVIRALFSELPTQSHILCVGVGTGSELLDLAQTFPGWHFTAVEPAAPMLAICRQRAEESGIAARCTFHEGYLDSLPPTAPFDAATCLLVSHFIMQPEARIEFFQHIAARLRPGGYLVNADLTSAADTATHQNLRELWQRAFLYAGLSDEEVGNNVASFGRSVALLMPQEMESVLVASGFQSPTLFLQTILIHAWYSRRA